MNRKNHIATIRITLTAIFMSLNIVMSSFGIPVPGGHLYFCDAVICLASILLNPFEAFIVGGIGSFIGDMIFYPASMFVSLFAHGLQAAAISLISHKTFKNSPKLASGIGVTVGSVIVTSSSVLIKSMNKQNLIIIQSSESLRFCCAMASYIFMAMIT